MENVQRRNSSYDLLRILACYMVLINHTVSGAAMFLTDRNSITFFASVFIFFVAKVNVIAFVFISGALLLKKDDTTKKWLLQRIGRTIAVIVIFSAIYYQWDSGSIGDYFRIIFTTNITNAFWFLYMYLGLMVLLPLIRAFVKGAGKLAYHVLFASFIVMNGIYPSLSYYFDTYKFSTYFSSFFIRHLEWIVVFIMGYYFTQYVDLSFSVKKASGLFIVWLAGTMIPSVVTVLEFRRDNYSLYMDDPFHIWSLAATISLILFVLMITKEWQRVHGNNGFDRIVSGLGELTFGVYLLGDYLIAHIPSLNITKNILANIAITDLCIMLIGFAITWVLKRIPLLQKLL